MKWPEDVPAPERSRSSLSGAMVAVTPDVTQAEEHRRRKELVRQRLLGDGPPVERIGRFTLLHQVGAGALSVIYAAHDQECDRRVAVKLLRAPLAETDLRLQREAQAMARLSHPNVVAVHETGHWEGRLFIAMELVEGQPLEQWLAAGHRSWQEIVDVFLQVGCGLVAAHGLGLVHRDFKLASVVIDGDGRARMPDFGPVRRSEPPGADGALPGVELGACFEAPAYMAPEQRAGLAADVLSDQFSFCVALHEALVGARPDAAVAPGRRRIPTRLARVVKRGLAADRRARWPSMRHLLCELERLRRPGRRGLRAAIAATVMVVVAATLALVSWRFLAP